MKWVFGGGFLLAMLLSLLAWVTRPVDHFAGVVQLVWATDDNPARQEQIALFQAWHLRHYGEQIVVRTDPTIYMSEDKIVVQSLAGVGPDLFDYFSHVSLESYVKAGIIVDVTDVAREKGFAPEQVWDGVRPSFVYGGRQYGFPDNTCDYALIYKKDFFDQAKLPYPNVDMTWSDFMKLADKLSRKLPNGQRQFAIMNIDTKAMVASNGAQLYTPRGTHCILDSPEAIEALQFAYDLSHKYHYLPTAGDLASQASSGGWGGGTANTFTTPFYAMRMGGRYEFIAWQRDTQALLEHGKAAPYHFGVVPMPRFKIPYGIVGSRATGINRNSKQVKYALRFLEFLASEEYNRQINRSFDALASVQIYCQGPTGIADGPPPLPGLEAANDPVWVTIMAYGHEGQVSPFIMASKCNQFYDDAWGHIDAGQISPADGLHEFARKVNAQIQFNISRDTQLRARYAQCCAQEGMR